jgi:hypothetical protein
MRTEIRVRSVAIRRTKPNKKREAKMIEIEHEKNRLKFQDELRRLVHRNLSLLRMSCLIGELEFAKLGVAHAHAESARTIGEEMENDKDEEKS